MEKIKIRVICTNGNNFHNGKHDPWSWCLL